jgi:hypothetical protein
MTRKRREEAARIIATNEQRRRVSETNELLLDQEALRQAAIRAAIEEPQR